MVWLILGGGFLLGLLILALAVRPVLARLPKLARALRAAEQRAADAQRLQAAAEALQARLAELEGQALRTQERAELIKARRAH